MNIYSLMTFLLRFTQINRVNQQALKFQNPLRNGTADPSMVWADGQYHLYAGCRSMVYLAETNHGLGPTHLVGNTSKSPGLQT